jgi:hypothetical protein
VLRDRWQTHIDASLSRPALIVDEAQEMLPAVLAELRLLSSTRLDSHILLTVVLAGDGRLLERLRSEELAPLGSRMRVRLALERAAPDELQELLLHGMQKAGAVKLMNPGTDRHARRSRPGQPARADDHRRRTARGRGRARGPPHRREAVPRDLRAACGRDQGGIGAAPMSLLPVEPAWRLAARKEEPAKRNRAHNLR